MVTRWQQYHRRHSSSFFMHYSYELLMHVMHDSLLCFFPGWPLMHFCLLLIKVFITHCKPLAPETVWSSATSLGIYYMLFGSNSVWCCLSLGQEIPRNTSQVICGNRGNSLLESLQSLLHRTLSTSSEMVFYTDCGLSSNLLEIS